MISAILSAILALAAQAGGADAPFDSIALQDGGEVVVRHGARAAFVVREGGEGAVSRVGGELRIAHSHRDRPRGSWLRVEVTVPDLSAVSVTNGGRIRLEGPFPDRERMAARVEQGGAIDIRPVQVGMLEASVYSGGQILARVERTLDARVAHGGGILYWGRPRLVHEISDGGVVAPGRPEDVERSFGNVKPLAPPPPPPVPPVH